MIVTFYLWILICCCLGDCCVGLDILVVCLRGIEH